MKSLTKFTLGLMAAGLLSTAPVLAAETAVTPAAGTQATAPAAAAPAQTAAPAAQATKPDLAGALKDKAAKVVEQGQQKVDAQAQKLKESLGVKKDSKDTEAKATEGGECAEPGEKATETKVAPEAKK